MIQKKKNNEANISIKETDENNNIKTIVFSNNNMENIVFNNNENNVLEFVKGNQNIEIEQNIAIKNENIIYKDDIVYLKELENQLLSEYPVTKQSLKFVQKMSKILQNNILKLKI